MKLIKRSYSFQMGKISSLEGVRVLDLTRIIAGPFCTQILGDLGANVIKVERPGSGDESRKWGPPFLSNSTDSVYFLASNRNKLSICVDLKKGRDIILDLAKKSDVLVENYVPGTLDKYGLGYDDLKRHCPQLIYTSITGYGSEGPYRNRPGYDVIAASVGGFLGITGTPNAPCKAGVAVTDIMTGLYAHGAILASLLHREKTGEGERIEVNLLSTQLASLINVGSSFLNSDHQATRWGTAHESIVPYQAFETKEGSYLTVGAGSDEQFQSLCLLLDVPDIAKKEEFQTNQDRVKNREKLIQVLSEIFKTKTNNEWMKIFAPASFPVGPVNTIKEVFEDPHVKAIGIVKTLDHPIAGKIRVVGPPVKYKNLSNEARSAPPTLGQHTNEILTSVLGYDKTKIVNLRNKGIIE